MTRLLIVLVGVADLLAAGMVWDAYHVHDWRGIAFFAGLFVATAALTAALVLAHRDDREFDARRRQLGRVADPVNVKRSA